MFHINEMSCDIYNIILSKLNKCIRILDYGFIDDNKSYDYIFKNAEILKNNNLQIHCINVNESYVNDLNNKLNKFDLENNVLFDTVSLFNISNIEKYNTVIFHELFSLYKEEEISLILEKIKLLNIDLLIFINSVIIYHLQYLYHPISLIKYVLNYIFNRNFLKPIYLTDIYEFLRQYRLKVIDGYRSNTINFPTYPIDCFIISAIYF
jgi:hypothetical protein